MKIAVITGASRGIGQEFARQIVKCYRQLDELWLFARDTEKLEVLKKELENAVKIKVKIYSGDLTRDYIYYRLLKDLEKEKPDIRILVNSAGFGKIGKTEDIKPEIQAQMVELNCKALTKMTCLCLPYLAKGSRIMNVASAAAFAPQPGFAVYSATKSYVLSFSRALGSELEEKKIIVTSVCPGPVDTAFFKTAGSPAKSRKKTWMAKPKDVVKKALWDTRNKRTVSVYGIPMKCAHAAAKLLPAKLILRVMKQMNF